MLAKNGHELEDWERGLATAFSNMGQGHFAREAALRRTTQMCLLLYPVLMLIGPTN